jgi:hypothetical protein
MPYGNYFLPKSLDCALGAPNCDVKPEGDKISQRL